MPRRPSHLARHWQIVVAIASCVGAVFAFGWRARLEFVEARASQSRLSANDTVIVQKLDGIAKDIGDLKTDVRLLKCAAKFPGDCPGQAKNRP